MAKRLTKDQLETDALVTYYYLTVQWIKQNTALVVAGTLAFFLIVGGGIWYFTQAAAQQDAARDALIFAERKFMQGDYEAALYGSEEEMEPGLIEIVSRYRRTTAGNLALYYAAISEVEMGNYESALEYIKDYRVPEGVMGVGPKSLHGSILMQLERFDDARRVFERAADWDVNDSTTPYNLMQAAEAAYAAGDYNRAARFVERIKKDFPDSDQVSLAERLHGMLTAL